jgi:hypothetical protein
MAFNSGGANPIGVKTGPRPEDAYVPPVNKETLNSIESKADASTDKGATNEKGSLVRKLNGQVLNGRESRITQE